MLLLEGDNIYDQLMNDFKKLIKEAVKEAAKELKNKSEQEDAKWITSIEAMKILDCKKDKLNQLRSSNSLKVTKHGRKILYYRPSLYSFLKEHSQ